MTVYAEIDWGGCKHNNDPKKHQPELKDDDGKPITSLATVSIASFKPGQAWENATVKQPDKIVTRIFSSEKKREVQPDAREDILQADYTRTKVYFNSPETWSSSMSPPSLSSRHLTFNIPYEAMAILKTAAQISGQTIDLTRGGARKNLLRIYQ